MSSNQAFLSSEVIFALELIVDYELCEDGEQEVVDHRIEPEECVHELACPHSAVVLLHPGTEMPQDLASHSFERWLAFDCD